MMTLIISVPKIGTFVEQPSFIYYLTKPELERLLHCKSSLNYTTNNPTHQFTQFHSVIKKISSAVNTNFVHFYFYIMEGGREGVNTSNINYSPQLIGFISIPLAPFLSASTIHSIELNSKCSEFLESGSQVFIRRSETGMKFLFCFSKSFKIAFFRTLSNNCLLT